MRRELVEIEGAEVDRALLEELAHEVEPVRTERAELTAWAADLQEAVLELLAGFMGGVLPWEAFLEGSFWVLLGIVGLVLLATLALGLRAWLGRGARARQDRLVHLVEARGDGLGEDPWARLARLKAAGEARAALTALWEAVATELTARGLGAHQQDATHREFVRSVRRDWPGLEGLVALAQRVERLQFSGEPVSIEVVEELEPTARALAGRA